MWQMQTYLIHVHFLYQEKVRCQFKGLQNTLAFSISTPLQEGAERASSKAVHAAGLESLHPSRCCGE